jgi:hypothetical protein
VREGITSSEAQHVKDLQREVRALCQANEILSPASAFLPTRTKAVGSVQREFIDDHRNPSGTSHTNAVRGPNATTHHSADRTRPPDQPAGLGADEVWRLFVRVGTVVARCTVERLMRRFGLRGVMRGKVVRITFHDAKAPSPQNSVNRQLRAERPNRLFKVV